MPNPHENKRWDPLTGVSPADLGMTFKMCKAGRNIMYKPYKVYKGGSRDHPRYTLQSPNGSRVAAAAFTYQMPEKVPRHFRKLHP
jgi:hypothetical protein